MILTVNGKRHDVDVPADKPLLWVLREDLNITGPKYGCGVAACGACTVHVEGKKITTIEGLGGGKLHALQVAWELEQVPQCGYCQPGFIMATAALLRSKPKPTDREIDDALTNICRCGTYSALRRAVHRAAALMAGP